MVNITPKTPADQLCDYAVPFLSAHEFTSLIVKISGSSVVMVAVSILIKFS